MIVVQVRTLRYPERGNRLRIEDDQVREKDWLFQKKIRNGARP